MRIADRGRFAARHSDKSFCLLSIRLTYGTGCIKLEKHDRQVSETRNYKHPLMNTNGSEFPAFQCPSRHSSQSPSRQSPALSLSLLFSAVGLLSAQLRADDMA